MNYDDAMNMSTVEFGDISMYFASVTGMNEEIEESGTLYIYRTSDEILSVGESIDNITYETDLANISTEIYLKHEVVNNVITASYSCITYIEDGIRKEYSIEITKIFKNNNSDNKSMLIKVTDENLINLTGGIVQGMSGAPIIQNGKFCRCSYTCVCK